MSPFPERKSFAFSIFDDTDDSTIENVQPVYRLLSELGLRTTKSVWPLANVPGARYGGGTLQDRPYLKFVLDLKDQGFEIALHNVRNSDSPRNIVERGLNTFQDLIGHSPRLHANHSRNRDNIYWGSSRVTSTIARVAYNCATRFSTSGQFHGHDEHSDYFWGDLCKEHISYVRNFVVREINLERFNPSMPYHDPSRPYVNMWFSSCEGANVSSFCSAIAEEHQDRLEAEHGFCIMYTHFACGFVRHGRLDPGFERLMRRLAARNGWFVPVSTLLDFLKSRRNNGNISERELTRMETRWLALKLRTGRA